MEKEKKLKILEKHNKTLTKQRGPFKGSRGNFSEMFNEKDPFELEKNRRKFSFKKKKFI